ncbi:MAG TPA: hypothetical protein VKT28_20860 [Puia sp.]|nr:hypothetical protein [Puia sp.]
MKLLTTLLIAAAFCAASKNVFEPIDPTGTYILKGNTEKNIIKGHNGEIRAKLLAENKLALAFYLDKGAPNFESASFRDTFFYFDNRISYHSPTDTDCIITFIFDATTIETFFMHSNPQCTCGFEKGVIIPATFEKSSDEIPIIKDLSRNGTN